MTAVRDLARTPAEQADADDNKSQRNAGQIPSEESFFSFYAWCLNPLQTVLDLVGRVRDEIARYDSLRAGWQREESRTNLYLFLCAACCATDDYLAHRTCDLSRVARRLPRLGGLIEAIDTGLNAVAAPVHSISRRRAMQWREELARCVDLICDILVAEDPTRLADLAAAVRRLSTAGLPASLLGWRARIPEAFRCQDMTHHDVFALAQRFLCAVRHSGEPVLIVGPRTAGAYFAPLVRAALSAQAIPVLGWVTIRPKHGLSPRERRCIAELLSRAPRVLIVDDHPNTGNTFAMMTTLLGTLGTAPEKIIVLAPDHPAQLDWTRAVPMVRAIVLSFDDLYKRRLLRDDAAIACILRELYAQQGWTDIRLQASTQVDQLNVQLAARLSETFEVRSKRVYRVRLSRGGAPPVERHVLAKSVGWGWLGYHAAIAGRRLREFVPPIVGTRCGLLFTEWVGALDDAGRDPTEREILNIVPSYVAARATRLSLDEDPCFGTVGYRRTGWDTLLRALCEPYGHTIGPLLAFGLKARLKPYVTPLPTLVDGGIGADWVASNGRLYKADFEHHNFGGAQPDVVDPCYDLACALRDLNISTGEEKVMLERYVRESGDAGMHKRLPLYKLLCGLLAMQTAAYCVVRGSSRDRQEAWNSRYNAARNFLNYQMARHSVRHSKEEPTTWLPKLFLLDIDGVFDSELFGPLFQHTTPDGLAALRLLKSHGYSVVLNTGRSLQHVRNYCQIYSLPGGIAEYGSAFFDAIQNIDLPLIDEEAHRQLHQCRIQLADMPGVFVDPGYQWSVRTYRYRGDVTVGLSEGELKEFLRRFELDRLSFIARDADSYFIQKGADKGSGTAFVKRQLANLERPIVAIGDSAQDLAMFDQADIAYMPANFAPAHQKAMPDSKYRAMRHARQRGLLAAVRDLTGEASSPSGTDKSEPGARDLLDEILRVADKARHRRLLGILRALAG